MEATERQLKFIDLICTVLEIENPKIEKKEEASKWIADHIEEYKTESVDFFYDWENELVNG